MIRYKTLTWQFVNVGVVLKLSKPFFVRMGSRAGIHYETLPIEWTSLFVTKLVSSVSMIMDQFAKNRMIAQVFPK